jgi:hypothetical protein
VKLYDQNGLQKRTIVPDFQTSSADTLAAAVDNYAPPGWGPTVTRLELTAASGGSVLTGLDSSVHQLGDLVAIFNVAAAVTDTVRFANDSGSSLAANRFTGIGGEDYELLPGAGVLLLCSLSGWRFFQ